MTQRMQYAVAAEATEAEIRDAATVPPGWSGRGRHRLTVVYGDGEAAEVIGRHTRALAGIGAITETVTRVGRTDSEIATLTAIGPGEV